MAIQSYLALLFTGSPRELRSLAMTNGAAPAIGGNPLRRRQFFFYPCDGGELVTGFKFSSLGGVRRSREVGMTMFFSLSSWGLTFTPRSLFK